MALKLNTSVLHKALGMAHAGDVDHGEWNAPTDRNESNCIGHEEGDEGKVSEWKYPILSNGKVSAKGVSSAEGYATKNGEDAIIPALKKISAAIHGTKDLSRATELLGQLADKLTSLPDVDVESLDLSRAPRLARCPNGECGSHDVERLAAASEFEGPKDRCTRCGMEFPHKPGTITAAQFTGKLDQPEQMTETIEHPGGEPPTPEVQGHDVSLDDDVREQPVWNANDDPMAVLDLPNVESGHARGWFGEH